MKFFDDQTENTCDLLNMIVKSIVWKNINEVQCEMERCAKQIIRGFDEIEN